LDRAEAAIRAAAPSDTATVVSDEDLANKLVELGIITSYQAQQMRNHGRTKFNLGLYIIVDMIGQGGMGHVFKAVHKMIGRECAVKVLPPHKTTDEAIANFIRESRLQAKLDHPNLVRVYDFGRDRNSHYLVMEYVPGQDLRRLIRSQSPLTIQQAASVIMQAALGLDYAHQSGLIHRDVKPGNILVTPSGVAKVSDLGLAAFVEEREDPRLGKIVGTPDYLSPEQIRNPHDVTKLTDIYSLGCTLYYAVTGKVPFPGGTAASKIRRILDDTPWHPRKHTPEISDEFVEVIADMMEKDPARRIQSCAEVASRLGPWASDISPIPSRQLARSPWTAPPLPTGNSGTQEDSGGYSNEDSETSRQESASQGSQGTSWVSTALQETQADRSDERVPMPPPLPISDTTTASESRDYLVTVLALSIPLALTLGILLGMVLRGWIG
jgi:serine/threonine protein kinase